MKRISVVTGCYNEEENIREVYLQTKLVFAHLPEYTYEHIFIDNASTDCTVNLLREIANKDPNVKVILNARNFGHVRSGYYGLLQAHGDAVISIVADLQDPPSLIKEFLSKWERGYKIVAAIKTSSAENALMYFLRKSYYKLVHKLADVELLENFTGFGLYDQSVIETLRKIDDPYPYFRGLICEIGFGIATIEYSQPKRIRGVTKNNFFTLYDMAMLGFTSHTKIPLRIAAMCGFTTACISLVIAFVYFIAKLLYWDSFSLGIAPLIISLFFFSSVQLFFIGIIGEYVGAIHTQVHKRPLVIEKERINW